MTIHNFSNGVALLISIYFLPEPGGGATAALNRAKLLKNIGYNVFIICGFPAYPTGKLKDQKYKGRLFYVEKIDEFTIIRLKLIALGHEGYLKRLIIFLNFVFVCILNLPRIIRITGKINIVYALAPILFSSIIGFFYSKITKSFFIYDVPDLWPEELVAFRSRFSPIIFHIGKILSKAMYSSPDIIITISSSAAEMIREYYRPNPPIYDLPIGFDPQSFQYLEKRDSRNKLITDKVFPAQFQGKFLIIYTGLISRAQKVENLLKLARKLDGDPDIMILIVGDGEDRSNIELETKNLKNVYLLPYQPRNVIPYIIYSSDLCSVLLSCEPIFEIAFPTKFYEYLACRKQILGICKGEMANIINKFGIGCAVSENDIDLLVPFIIRIKRIHSDLGVETKFDKAINEFSLENLSKRLNEILSKEM